MGGIGKQYSYNDGIGDGGVDLLVVNPISLLVALYNLFCLVSDWLSLRVFFDFINLFILKDLFCIRPRNQISGLIFYQVVIFFFYSLLSECGICRIYSLFVGCGFFVYLFRGHIIILYYKYEALSL